MGTLAATIDATGISAPDFDDTHQQLKVGYFSIFGSDANLDDDSQDGQLLAIFSRAIFDLNQLAIGTYNSFSPLTAQGNGLASVVKINGLKKLVASNSQAPVTIVGQTGALIEGGLVGDNANLNTTWALPAQVTIPESGSIDVTATCTDAGATPAAPGTLTVIKTPTLGWQSVTNANAASPGQPVETDAALRRRQSVSTANPSQTVLEGIRGTLASLTGVGRLAVYENDTDELDANGIPDHSIAVVISGGDATEIAQAIALKKGPGPGTFGTTSEIVIDPQGMPNTIKFFPLTTVPITLHVTIKALTGYVSTTGDALLASLSDFIGGLSIGETSFLNRLWVPANLNGDNATDATGLTQAQLDVLSKTFNVTSIMQARGGGAPAAADVAIAFNEAAMGGVANFTLTVT
jgi:uncharacterized phage protein gp47/JayE